MGKGTVLYQSKYGSTKKYAQWLGEKMRYDCIETKKADIKMLEQFGTIILGGGVYASGIFGLSFLKKNICEDHFKMCVIHCAGALHKTTDTPKTLSF